MSSQKSNKKSTRTAKTRRRIDLTPSLPKSVENLEVEKAEEGDHGYVNKRMETFERVWSKIELTIKVRISDSDPVIVLGYVCSIWLLRRYSFRRDIKVKKKNLIKS